MQLYPFSALLGRMKYIHRWSLMRAARTESLAEHTAETAQLAHLLCLIARRITGAQVRPKTVAVAALYHDAPEILTGDLPTPVKYRSQAMREAYDTLEAESIVTLRAALPGPLEEELAPYLSGGLLTEKERQLLKAADRLSALIKCMEEAQNGSREFSAALAQQKAALAAMGCAEADYFVEHLLPCYEKNLDELTRLALR
ncbi:MAG TPA: 5'-deoxynucleotidase [Candidatus Anaerofilum excrementigallinarum]|nr:5'-deoxynucleotidase [Candidatus Anaerofilum excrementigallinarum]